jgi:hypothetical protein
MHHNLLETFNKTSERSNIPLVKKKFEDASILLHFLKTYEFLELNLNLKLLTLQNTFSQL